jgi:hypothetical protein
MARLDLDTQKRLEPERFKYAKEQIEKLGFKINQINNHEIQFVFKNKIVKLFPYSGWFSGKSIKDGRGIQNLLNQLK